MDAPEGAVLGSLELPFQCLEAGLCLPNLLRLSLPLGLAAFFSWTELADHLELLGNLWDSSNIQGGRPPVNPRAINRRSTPSSSCPLPHLRQSLHALLQLGSLRGPYPAT